RALGAGIASGGAGFGRGWRGRGGAPSEIPKIGVVEMDPNFKPRIELVPPKLPPAPALPEPFGGDSAPAGGGGGGGGGGAERGARSRGGRGGRGGSGTATGRDERTGSGERPGRGGRGGG